MITGSPFSSRSSVFTTGSIGLAPASKVASLSNRTSRTDGERSPGEPGDISELNEIDDAGKHVDSDEIGESGEIGETIGELSETGEIIDESVAIVLALLLARDTTTGGPLGALLFAKSSAASSDEVSDTSSDRGSAAKSDTSAAGTDPKPYIDSDVGSDVGSEVGSDIGSDGGSDVGSDVGSDETSATKPEPSDATDVSVLRSGVASDGEPTFEVVNAVVALDKFAALEALETLDVFNVSGELLSVFVATADNKLVTSV